MKRILFSILILICSLSNQAVNRYVATTGSDSNTGTLLSPFLTITKGVDMARAGDTVFVKAGIYNERLVVYGYDGTETNPIVIKNYPGDRPIIDGTGVVVAEGSGMVVTWQNWINISGFEVRNVDIGIYATGSNSSFGTGLVMAGNHCIAKDIIIHDIWANGITMLNDYSTVDNCVVYNTAMSNSESPGLSNNGGGIFLYYTANHSTIKNCSIHNIWGEGLTVAGSYNIYQDNSIYDCWETNVYIIHSNFNIFQRNFIYQTGAMSVGNRVGILVGDERSDIAFSANNTIINNIVYGCRRNFYWWGSNYGTGMINVLIANNTFVNSTYTTNFQINPSPTHSGVQIKNNIFSQDISLGNILINYTGTPTGITFSNNLWHGTYDSRASCSEDVIGDPKLTNILSRPFDAVSYQLTSSSPAINAGINIGLTTDFLGNAIVGLPDIGAYEFIVTNGGTFISNPKDSIVNSQSKLLKAGEILGTGVIHIRGYTRTGNPTVSAILQASYDNIIYFNLNTDSIKLNTSGNIKSYGWQINKSPFKYFQIKLVGYNAGVTIFTYDKLTK